MFKAEFAPVKQLAIKSEIQSVKACTTITAYMFLLFMKIVAKRIPPHIAFITCIVNVKGSINKILGM